MDYREQLNQITANYNKRKGFQAAILEEDSKCLELLQQLTDKLDIDLKVSALLQDTASDARLKAKEYLENVVTNALKYISDGEYTFEIDIQEMRGKPDAEFYIVSEVNGEISRQKPEDSNGGGFVDIIATALRYAYLELFNNPTIKGPLILDEPGKMVSESMSIKFAEFIKQLCDEFGRQTIIVTHNENIQAIADNTIGVALQNEQSVLIDYRIHLDEEDRV